MRISAVTSVLALSLDLFAHPKVQADQSSIESVTSLVSP